MTDQSSKSVDRIREEWTIGAYPNLAQVFLGMAARLVGAAEVGADDHVLDVACGTGNVAITAARRSADVTGVDITPAMLEAARERAAVIDADVDWQEGNAESLPLEDDAFDVTVSCLGHIFAEDADATADELVRVTKPGGRIGFTAWTPSSGIAAMVKVLLGYLPPQPNAPEPPVLWGDPDTVRERFGDRVEDLHFETETVMYPALSPAHFWEAMTTDSGSIVLMVNEVDENERAALRAAEIEAIEPFFSDEHNAVELEYRLGAGTVL